ncbi:MAG TPA: hypothetical protein VFW91_19105, partial [Candidatus Binatia bacterium]|nr:hypothetical protein [Candidatus Binatia bacterium]
MQDTVLSRSRHASSVRTQPRQADLRTPQLSPFLTGLDVPYPGGAAEIDAEDLPAIGRELAIEHRRVMRQGHLR